MKCKFTDLPDRVQAEAKTAVAYRWSTIDGLMALREWAVKQKGKDYIPSVSVDFFEDDEFRIGETTLFVSMKLGDYFRDKMASFPIEETN